MHKTKVKRFKMHTSSYTLIVKPSDRYLLTDEDNID